MSKKPEPPTAKKPEVPRGDPYKLLADMLKPKRTAETKPSK